MSKEHVWEFKTAQFRVVLSIEQDYGHVYDGDDEDGETQRKLDNGDYVAFDSLVRVYWRGKEIAWDSLGASVYETNNVKEFWTAHRDSNPMNRNCMLQKATTRYTIGHYFPSMVRQAVREARKTLCEMPKLRCK